MAEKLGTCRSRGGTTFLDHHVPPRLLASLHARVPCVPCSGKERVVDAKISGTCSLSPQARGHNDFLPNYLLRVLEEYDIVVVHQQAKDHGCFGPRWDVRDKLKDIDIVVWEYRDLDGSLQ